MNSFLIPANTKKSLLIFGLFNKIDLILFGCGLGVTTILLLSFDLNNVAMAMFALAPALITGFLVMPVPNYHNILTVITSCIEFYTNKRKFIWKGWCFPHGEEDKK